jgi:hypothetical protein
VLHVCDFLAGFVGAPWLAVIFLSFVRDAEFFYGSLLVLLVAWSQASLGEGGE